ncbi:MAG TPA: T3SS effector HopA1 family protein, partial [Ktedonobacterales bacterium]
MNEPRGEHRAQVEAALRATAIHSPTSYSWFGAPSPPLAAKVRRALSTAADHEYLHVMLRSQLYTDCFCRGAASPPAAGVVGLPAVEMAAFVEALSAANDGRGRWEDGWEVLAIGDGGVAVRKDGLEVWARREDCRAAGTGAMALGARVCLRLPRESPARSPGYYVALGDAEDVAGTGQTVVRLYWHLTAEGAMPFVRLATAMLNRARLPFTLKVVNHPGRFTRCDAAVVYLARRDFAAAAEVLGELYPEMSGGLRPATPVFTKRLAPGLGLAEDPSEGPSFGLQRCQLLAEGMIRAYEAGARTLDGRMRAVEERFAEAGVNLDEPFLNPGSRDEYAFQMDRPRAGAGRGAGETHYEDTDGGALTTESTERQREGWNGTAEDAEGRGAEPERRRGMKPQ